MIKDEEVNLTNILERAKHDQDTADQFIRQYMPFIKVQTTKFTKKSPQDGLDDELSIAMFAFYEAMLQYQKNRGTFIKFAERVIRNRLIDYYRQEKKHRGMISLDQPFNNSYSDKEETRGNKIQDKSDDICEIEQTMATQAEINHFISQLSEFAISMTEVADSCPKQDRTLQVCMDALDYVKSHRNLLDEMIDKKQLPIGKLCEATGLQRKTLERHRKYIIAIFLAFTNGFEIIRGHLCQIKRGGKKE